MEYTDVRRLAELMREMELTVLEITEKEFSVRMERGGRPAAAAASPVPSAGVSMPEKPQSEAEAGTHTVASPMIGVFYASPSPDGKPYVSVGDTVRAGQVLCVIEAMKIMNEITSEVTGVVTEVCVSDRQIVEYGHPLFRIRLSDSGAQPDGTP